MVHTHAGHAPTFARLWGETSELNLAHLVDDALLTACQVAPDSPATAQRIADLLEAARSAAPVVGVSCVLVGAVALQHGLDSRGGGLDQRCGRRPGRLG